MQRKSAKREQIWIYRKSAGDAEMPLTNGKAVIPADFCHSHSSAEILYRFVKQ